MGNKLDKLEEDLEIIRLMAERKGIEANKLIDIYLDAPVRKSAIDHVREKIEKIKKRKMIK